MRVVLTGGTGVLGRAAVRALREAGHEVVVVCRSEENHGVVESLDAIAVDADLFDVDALSTAFEGADAAVSLATNVPVGYAAVLPLAWKRHDRLRTEGVATVVEAARRAGVRRVIQESVSVVYADQGSAWITESSPVESLAGTEPVAVAESHVHGYTCDSRAGVVLRFGQVMGDDPMTRYWLKAAAHGRPVGVGSPDQWAHLLHTDDIGSAVVAALIAPPGVYNVGAEPVRKSELIATLAEAIGVEQVGFLGPVSRRLAAARFDALMRSHRVSSELFTSRTGWHPTRASLTPDWFLPAIEAVDR